MLLMDWLKEEFYSMIDDFEKEKISYDEFMEFLNSCGQNQIESVGEEVWRKWLRTKRNHNWMRQFNRNENQITLF